MQLANAEQYLTSLLNKVLRLHTTDTRMFVGEFKCTDNEQNIILASCHEYRLPLLSTLSAQAVADKESQTGKESGTKSVVTANMTSRFLGLVVVPGQYITRIEVEEENGEREERDACPD